MNHITGVQRIGSQLHWNRDNEKSITCHYNESGLTSSMNALSLFNNDNPIW